MPFEGMEYSMRMEQDQALRLAERVVAAMAKCVRAAAGGAQPCRSLE